MARRLSWRLVSLAAAAIVVLAFGGGALSGKLQHLHGATSTAAPPHPPSTTTPPTPRTTTPPTSTTAPPTTTTLPRETAAAVMTDVVTDMGLDLSSQALDPNHATRATIARSPAAVGRRHAAIAMAWAPDKVAAIEANYDALVAANAANPVEPSFSSATFLVTSWGPVNLAGMTATLTVAGHYQLSEPHGTVARPDAHWALTVHLVAGRWLMETRTAS